MTTVGPRGELGRAPFRASTRGSRYAHPVALHAAAWRVLGVDGDPEQRRLVSDVLTNSYQIRWIKVEAPAFAAVVREERPELVLLVGLNRTQVAEMIHAVRTDNTVGLLPIVLVGCILGAPRRAEALELGADDSVEAPIDTRLLRAAVAAHSSLNRRRDQKAIEERETRQSVEDFLATFSHELRSPLQALSIAVELMRRGIDGPRALTVIERQVGQMRALVEDVLDLSRVARGKVELHLEVVDMAVVAREAVEAAESPMQLRSLCLTSDIEPEGLRVMGDRVRLQQVLTNLLNNSAKFTPSGGHVEVCARRSGNVVAISVTDNGRGIEPSVLPRVFDLFVQGSGGSEGGLGVGLGLSARLVQLHGGSIEAHSAGREKGARFVVKLPAVA